MADPIEIVNIDSWDGFIDGLRELSPYGTADFYFRGQSDQRWHLTPTLQRRFTTPLSSRDLYLANRNRFLRAFRDHAHGVQGFPSGLTRLDQLIV